MSEYPITVFFSNEDSGWIAEIPDLPGCTAYGDTPEQAVAEVGVAKLAWLETAQAEGRPIPEPSQRPASASG
jgi:predicted RNase H-like HicB family nuclease